MGPILKTLLGLFLFVWTVLGGVILVGGVLLGLQLPKLVASLSDLTSGLNGLTNFGGPAGGERTGGPGNGQQIQLDPQVQACLEKELGANFMQKFGSGTEPSAKDQAAFDKCGFTPPENQPPSANQPPSSPRPTGTTSPKKS